MYLSNWVEQANLICESKFDIGLIGGSYFVGQIIATSLIPIGYLSDWVGRKWIFICNTLITILGCMLLYVANSIEHICIGMFILGMSGPGRMIVCLVYADEFLNDDQKAMLMPLNNIWQGVLLGLLAFYYQVISR
jgi:MFS family permease